MLRSNDRVDRWICSLADVFFFFFFFGAERTTQDQLVHQSDGGVAGCVGCLTGAIAASTPVHHVHHQSLIASVLNCLNDLVFLE